jgi:hypothetical protein
MDCRVKPGNDEAKNILARAHHLVIARSESDEAIQSGPQNWIASLRLQ